MQDYTSLQASIASWLKRKDLTTVIPDLIRLAETKLSDDIKSHEQDGEATLTAVQGNAYLDLPADFRSVRSLAIPTGSVPHPAYVAPEVMADRYQFDAPGSPEVYTIIGRSLKFAPAPDAAYPVALVYTARVPPLSNAAPTNWLLERAPNAYLFGALLMAQPYLVNDVRLPMFQQMYADAVSGINGGDWQSPGALRIRNDGRNF